MDRAEQGTAGSLRLAHLRPPAALRVAGIALLLAILPAAVLAQATLTELRVNAFPGASNLPVWVAQHQGFFARQGIAVTLSNPQGSLDQFKGLVDGRYPVVVTAFDNVIAYHSGQGTAEVGAIPDLVAIMGIDSGLLSLMADRAIGRTADLEGHTLAVDALSTGFSFALREILLRAQVNASGVSFIAVGNSDNRWKAIQDGRAQAALLTLPTDLEAAEHGARPLTTLAASFGHYLGNVVAVRRGWATTHRGELQSLVRGMSDAVPWLTGPAHRAEAIAILHAEMPALDATRLDRVYTALVEPRLGLSRNGALDPAGARTVLDLRQKYGSSNQRLAKLAEYADPRYLAARAALR